MKPILILYATREGHTRRIAEHFAAAIRARGGAAEILNAAEASPAIEWNVYSGAILAASVHVQKHEPEMVRFVKTHRHDLERMRSVFVSVSLAEAGAEDPTAPPERRAQASAEVAKMIQRFLLETGWRPARVYPAAGALLYTRYNFFIRFVMKWIAKRNGASTDTSRDHIYTDWAALDRVVNELLATLG